MLEQDLQQLPNMIKERSYQMQRMQELKEVFQPKGKGGKYFFGKELSTRAQKALAKDEGLQERAERLIQNTLEQYLSQIEQLYHFIYQIEDSEMRLILLARFVDGKSWQAVATAVGSGDESYVRKKCHKFFKECQRKEDGNAGNGKSKTHQVQDKGQKKDSLPAAGGNRRIGTYGDGQRGKPQGQAEGA